MLVTLLSSYASFCYGAAVPFVAWLFVSESAMKDLTPKQKTIFAAFVLTAPISFPVALYFINLLSKVEFRQAS